MVVENFAMETWNRLFILLAISFFTFPIANCANPRNLTLQRVRSFHCTNNNYIFSNWFCDGINDCGDASDESYGCDAKCGIGNFTCQSDSVCLPISVRCNNQTDCSDGSDENFCFHEPSFDDCIITKGKYLCKDKLRCIEISRVCDEEAHCYDASDEGGKCDDYDHEKCNVCPHACFRTPSGPQCFYDTESGTYDEVHKDILACPSAKNNCDQKCVTYHEINQCSCEENFVPNYTLFGAFSCDEKEKNKNWLIFTTDKAIMGIPGYGNQSKVIEATNTAITAIAAGNEFVYWGGQYEDRVVIKKASLTSPDFERNILISEGIDKINAMDVDWRTGNIYFIDNGKNHIAACRNDGKLCIEVVALENFATSISLAPREGFMFWSIRDEEYGFVIKKGDMNGQSSYNFVDEGLGDILSIACDEAAEKLYWLDTTRRKIEIIRFNGEGRKVFKSDLRISYKSITINARYLVWNVNKNNSTSKTDPNNPNNIYYSPGTRVQPKIALNGSDPVQLIYGYSYSEKTSKMTPPCDWGCDNGICLMHSLYQNKTGSDCICANTSHHMTNAWCTNTTDNYLGYNYNYEDHYYYYPREAPHKTVRIIAVIFSVIFIIGAVCFYLYYKGCFHGIDVIRHARL